MRPDAPTLLAEAAVELREGRTRNALALVRRALELGFVDAGIHLEGARLLRALGEDDAALAALLRARALAPGEGEARTELRNWGLLPAEPAADDAVATLHGALPRTPGFDPVAAGAALRTEGIVVLRAFASPAECEELRARRDDDPSFVLAQALASEVGTLSRAVLREPLAADLQLMMAEAYQRAAEIGNDLRRALRGAECFPLVEPRPLLLSDRAVRLTFAGGAGYPPRRDPGDRQSFPLRGAVALGPGPLEVRLHDLRPGKPRMRRAKVRPGALALFCGRERPVTVGGVLGLQPVEWELAVPDAGEAGALSLAWPHVVSAPG